MNSLNQYTSVSGTDYSYDDNGNLTDDGTYDYYYDCENRLMDVNDANGQRVATYSYDYNGRRIYKTINGTITNYCYDGDQVIAEYDPNATLLRKFIYGPGIDEPICMIDVTDSNAVYYYHFDGLGSVAALSDANGVLIESYSYDIFGEPNRTSDVGNPYLFTGRRFDPETALYYYRARYYSPEIGRFLQTDPIGYEDGLNLYTYVGNNPLNWTDPKGEFIGKIYHCIVCMIKVGKVAKECGKSEPEPPDDDACLEEWIKYLQEHDDWRIECLKKIKKLIPSCAKCIWAIPGHYKTPL